MNPDVFITIAFSGIAVLVVLVPLVLTMPRIRREAALVQERELGRSPSGATPGSTPKGERGAPVH
jgi:hypothetical protein